MKFCPLDLCKKLEALGCKSESGFYWGKNGKEYLPLHGTDKLFDLLLCHPKKGSFIYQDFIGPSEQAKKNAEIIFKLKLNEQPLNQSSSWYVIQARITLINLPESEFWPLIERSLK